MTEPSRMRETMPEIGVAIDALREHTEPRAADVAALAARIAATAQRGAEPLSTFARKRTWWLLSLPILALLATSALLLMARQDRSPHVTAPHVPAAPPMAPLAPRTSAPPVIGATPEIAAKPAAPRTRAPRTAPVSPPLPGDPETELSLLRSAQAALGHDAGRALALADTHSRDYPAGVFVQERELLAIEALLKLGRREAAHARAEDFVARFPHSAHVRRLAVLLAAAPAQEPQRKPENAPSSVHPTESKARFR